MTGAWSIGFDIHGMCVTMIPGWTKVGVPAIGRCKGTLDALLKGDMVPLFAARPRQVRQAGVRVQTIVDAPDDLERLRFPRGLKEAVIHAGKVREARKHVRVPSPHGTHLTRARGACPATS